MIDLWTYLAKSDKPIVMYGMGNGADKILAVCERYGIKVLDFFASDEFVRGHDFHGKRVLKFSEIKEKYRDFIILLSFGTNRPDVLCRIYEMASEYEMYAPDLPLFGDKLFNLEFYEENRARIEGAKKLLCDAISESIYKNIIDYKLTGRIDLLKKSFIEKKEVFSTLLRPAEYKTYVDLGAYNADTIRELIGFGAHPEKIIAFEPDEKSFKKLAAFAGDQNGVELYNVAAWDSECKISFQGGGSRSSQVTPKGQKQISALPLDKISSAHYADFIKYDVEGSEIRALAGSAEIIRKRHPDLLVSVYHKSEDLFEIIHYVNSLYSGYKLYLRRFEYVPAWDLCLIATDK